MALRNEQILPAVIVKILESGTPAGTAGGQCAQSSFQAYVVKSAAALVAVKAVDLTRQHGDEDVGAAVVVVILKDGAHSREALAVGGERHAGLQRAFGKSPIAIIVEQ